MFALVEATGTPRSRAARLRSSATQTSIELAAFPADRRATRRASARARAAPRRRYD
jgi:hypothetical protein